MSTPSTSSSSKSSDKDSDTSTTKSAPAPLVGGHDIKISEEPNDQGEPTMVVRCDPCEFAVQVPANDEAAAKAIARDHSRS